MEALVVFSLALGLSTDAFGAGVSYGLRKIAVPFCSRLIISFLSAAALAFSCLAGQALARLMPPPWAARTGGFILLAMGLRLLAGIRSSHQRDLPENGALLQFRVRPLGLVVQVLREPHRADLDRSGTLSAGEALLLGLALALDALAGGLAVPCLNLHPLASALTVGLGQFALFTLGLQAGRRCGAAAQGHRLAALPGIILVFLGLLKLR